MIASKMDQTLWNKTNQPTVLMCSTLKCSDFHSQKVKLMNKWSNFFWLNNYKNYWWKTLPLMWRENCWKPKTNYKSKNNLMKTTKFFHPFQTGVLHMATGMTLKPTNGYPIKIWTSWKCYLKKIKPIKRSIKPLGLAVMFSIPINPTLNASIINQINQTKFQIP